MASEAVRPWFHRLVAAIPGSRPTAALSLIGGLGALGAAAFLVDGWLGVLPGSPYGLADAIGGMLILALILLAGWYVVEGFSADLGALRPAVSLGDAEFARLQDASTRFPRAAIRIATFAGPLVPLSYLLLGVTAPEEASDLLGVWLFLVLVVDWAVIAPMLLVAAIAMSRMWQLGRSGVRIDLMDPGVLAPFARFGLRLALITNVGGGLLMVNALVVRPEYRLLWLAVFAPIALLGFTALLLPSWGVHRRLRDAKAAELLHVRAALRGDRSALRESPLAPEADTLSLVDLARWCDRIEAQSEWPFDAAALRRFGLYLLIPLASWVGAALVERLLDLLL